MIKQKNEDIAYEKIKRAMMLKRLVAGQRVTEEWVGNELKMSRTPIRAAFNRLENEGLIELVPHRGAFVCNPSDKELEDVFNLRIVLESYAAELAVHQMTEENFQEMDQLLEEERKAYEKKDYEEFLRINAQIHAYPARVAQNKFLLQEVEKLNQWSDCYLILRDNFYSTPMNQALSIPEHQEVVTALKKRDIAAAKKAIEAHMLSTLNDLSERTSIFN
ncbi:GntR family transcriptional regulator [Halobacillus karajensis]|uniref:HTH-type transcriptional regulator YdfH n=1 Tax=Halobacillus karajensis TaxID=195088 RepID=A0A059NZ06_9BACI|nr:GntR family transcriptional regulator [Halobacillus karajensis]CDQ18973.1 putative HTH-type transcriptional regulator YdfH [Halobacillus karajensis]CDQ22953.1 putative HTH-type transcriptional regulator YdfH [Halobacillus karajensis]CDQ26436.1 putative HTH-type transcriptional regulator YdfH [Halobacillus karajensis]